MNGGVILAPVLMLMTMVIAYITTSFMIETISLSSAKRYVGRSQTLFPLVRKSDQDPELLTQSDMDTKEKDSPFYIRQKLEVSILAEDHVGRWFKMVVIVILIIYMYGAMTLKYVAGAESCIEGISMTIYGDQKRLDEVLAPFDPYYLGLALFGGLSIVFSFGNIENSKGL